MLHRKSELHQELSRRRDTKRVKEMEDKRKNRRTSFEMKLEEQANKLSLVSDCYLNWFGFVKHNKQYYLLK